jgi:hypothetical protein
LDVRTQFLIITYVSMFYIWLINLYDMQISLSVIGTGHNIMTEQWFVYMKQRFLYITSDNVVFNEKNFLRVQKRNCVISLQLRPFSRHKSGKWTCMYLCIDFASFCDYLLDFVFRFISRYFRHHHKGSSHNVTVFFKRS